MCSELGDRNSGLRIAQISLALISQWKCRERAFNRQVGWLFMAGLIAFSLVSFPYMLSEKKMLYVCSSARVCSTRNI